MRSILFLLSFLVYVLADVEFTAPKKDETFTAKGDSVEIDIKWKDDSDEDSDYSLKKASSYSVLLCTGSSNSIECFHTFVKVKKLDDAKSYTADIDTDLCDDGYYFFQVAILFSETQFTIHYTNRFELKGMKGSTKSLTVANTFTGDSPPDQTSGTIANINSKSFSIPYTEQTGKTRYAPMQMQPPTKVTAKSWTRKFPTSAVTYYSTRAPTPSIKSTITPGWSYTYKSVANWASPAPTPSVKYNPSDRVTPASLSTASKKKRWLD